MFRLFQQHPECCTMFFFFYSFHHSPSSVILAKKLNFCALGWHKTGACLLMGEAELANMINVPLFFLPFFKLELQPCCVFLPNDSLPSPSTIICGDIPGTVRSWYHNQTNMPGTLVVCLPQISILSAGHKYMEPLQELPFVVSKPILEEGRFSYHI